MDRDFLLVQKMRMGDEKAFDVFIGKYYSKILKYCQVHVDDLNYAEDMTQETFTKFFRTFNQYQHYGKAVNYLYVIASNVCKDYYKKKKEVLLEDLPERSDPSTENLDRNLDIRIALESLPKELREVAILFFIQEQRQKDIAQILGISLSLVKYRIRKVRELLSIYFGKEPL